MKRLYLTVEGQTEAAFAVETLGPHLQAYNVFLSRPRFTGPHGRRGGRVPRGGMFNTFHHVLEDIRRWLKEDPSSDARFSMMVDLYHLPRDFPGYDAGMALPSTWDQVDALERSLAAELADERFIPYLQVHEFEALVLADPRKLNDLYERRSKQVQTLAEECARFESPEQIDHGQHSHPKYRIHRAVPQYDENVAGPLLVQDIGLNRLRQACPHFGAWLTVLERLDGSDT